MTTTGRRSVHQARRVSLVMACYRSTRWSALRSCFSASATPTRSHQLRYGTFEAQCKDEPIKGIIMTTWTFTAEARKEATRDGVPPIEPVDGKKMIAMFSEFELGLSLSKLSRSTMIGSHGNFVHPKLTKPLTISGRPGDDAKHYQVRAVQLAIEETEK